MPTRPELVRVLAENGQEVSVGRSFAESHNLDVLDKPARNRFGHALPATPAVIVELKGQALEDALEAAGLSKAGTADEKRQRLADHQASGGALPPGGNPDGGA